MQIDFHYYVIRILCEKAGFSPNESQIIAYSSQYVDDATEHLRFKIEGNPNLAYPRYDGEYFDPICTAHKGLQFIEGIRDVIQKKIYIAFHFIPKKAYIGKGDFNYLTHPGGIFAKSRVEKSLKALDDAEGDLRLQLLIRLGIALHSFADTWAHQNFSGRHSARDNDISQIEIYEDNEWKKIPTLSQLKYNLFPDIGHAEAFNYPDQSHLIWRYIKAHSKEKVTRNNVEIFIEAAKTIFQLLSANQNNKSWQKLKPRLKKCFELPTDSVNAKIKYILEIFPKINFYYDDHDWLNQAVHGNHKELKSSKNKPNKEIYKYRGDKKWFYFHMEAMRQRQAIISHIPR